MLNNFHSKKKQFLKYSYCLFFVIAATILLQSCNKKKTENREKHNNNKKLEQLIQKGDSLYDISNTEGAIVYLKKAVELFDSKTDKPEHYVRALTLLSNIQQNYGDYYGSEETITKTFPYLKKIKDTKYESTVYSIIATNYYFNYDSKNSLLYHKKALKISKRPFKKYMVKCSLAFLKIQENKYEEAATILIPLAAKKIKHETNAILTEAQYSMVLGNLGYCYIQLKNPNALKYLERSLEIDLKLKDEYSLISTYNSFSLYYEKINPELSKKYKLKAYYSACKANNASAKSNTLAELMKVSKGKDLRKFSDAYITIIDSIIAGRKKAKNQSFAIKYNFNNDKEENLELKSHQTHNKLLLERQKSRSIVSYVIITFTVCSILFLSLYLTLNGKKEKNEAIYKSESRISKKLDNELANDVYHTILFANKAHLEQAENKEKLLNNLEAIYSRTRNISKENSHIVTDKNYAFYLKEMIASFKTYDVNILSNGLDNIAWNKIDRNKKIIVYRVIQELFSNMKKHSNATLSSITFKIIEKNILVNYSDNGDGIEDGRIILKKGLQNVENRIKTINGTVNFDINSEKGFKISFTFPL